MTLGVPEYDTLSIPATDRPTDRARPHSTTGTRLGEGRAMAKVGEGDDRWIVEDRADGTNVHGWHWQEKDAMPWARARFEETCVGLKTTLILYHSASSAMARVETFLVPIIQFIFQIIKMSSIRLMQKQEQLTGQMKLNLQLHQL